jgi:hypothetical protein
MTRPVAALPSAAYHDQHRFPWTQLVHAEASFCTQHEQALASLCYPNFHLLSMHFHY